MEKWRVRDPKGGEDDSRYLTRLSVYVTVFRCSVLGRDHVQVFFRIRVAQLRLGDAVHTSHGLAWT